MSISLTKSLKTSKVAVDPGNVAQGHRLFVSNPTCNIPTYLVDTYGRNANITAGLQFEGVGAPGCVSSQYRIQVENNNSRPQYSQYLNVPQGLMATVSEYPNQPSKDMLGVYRDKSFGLDGVYQRMAYPEKATDPNSSADFLAQQQWMANQLVTKFDSRLWTNSTDVQSGF